MIRFILIVFFTLINYFIFSQNNIKKKLFKQKKIIIQTKKNKNNFCYIDTNSNLKFIKFNSLDSLWFNSKEDSLIYYLNLFQKDTTMESIKTNDSIFISILSRTLNKPFSFYYNFNKLNDFIYITNSPDSIFKIITWQYSINNLKVYHQGLIQIKTYDSSLKIFPLFDRKFSFTNIYDTIFNAPLWIGSNYYDIIINKDKVGKKIYTLLGFDENTVLSNKKTIEILTFNQSCIPVFGGDYFNFNYKPKETNIKTDNNIKNFKRYDIEYNKTISVNLRYDKNLDCIIFDHLYPQEYSVKERKYSYSVDGEYDGFKWENGKWKYIPNIIKSETEINEIPFEKPIKFENRLYPINRKK